MLSFNNKILLTFYLFGILYCDTYFPIFITYSFMLFAMLIVPDFIWNHLYIFMTTSGKHFLFSALCVGGIISGLCMS